MKRPDRGRDQTNNSEAAIALTRLAEGGVGVRIDHRARTVADHNGGALTVGMRPAFAVARRGDQAIQLFIGEGLVAGGRLELPTSRL